MNKQEPKEVNHLYIIWLVNIDHRRRRFYPYSFIEVCTCTNEMKKQFWHLKAKMDEYKQEIQDLTEEIQSIEDSDPFENFEPIRDESRD